MVAQPHRSRMSVEDYLTLDRSSSEVRYEYIDGYAYALAGGSLNHSRIKLNIASLLNSLLRDSACNVYDSDARVRLSKTRYVYPDASVSCDARDLEAEDTLQYPLLIVEVLSPNTEADDRGEKFAYYRACPTIEEYVLVGTRRQVVEVYRREQEKFWKLYLFESGDQVELASLDIRFPIAAIYEKTTLHT